MSTPPGPVPLGPSAGAGGPVRRHRPARWALVLVSLLVLLSVEVWLLSQLAGVVGGLGVLVLLLVETVAGAAVLRRAGRSALRALRAGAPLPVGPFPGTAPGAVAAAGRRDGGRVGDAVLVGAGGALLVLPGLLSDVLALLCLLPPTRALLRRLGARVLRARVRRALLRAGLDPRAAERLARAARPGARGGVVDGEVVEGEVVEGEVVEGGVPPEDGPGRGDGPRALGRGGRERR
ncbi:FxsA family protein [Kineococcus gypseus]|uniref:FxsA family protein n=1 Tax=Kineococcus gypseus TaxID=1637102 RepID=UPI003D7DC86A